MLRNLLGDTETIRGGTRSYAYTVDTATKNPLYPVLT